jgi:AcrR family transcriptional regulator
MAKRRQPPEKTRRIPRQNRAAETVSAILEGAAQVLEAGGLAAFTTNAAAERAGVSIGTLYQYFADKNALLRALAEREVNRALTDVARALDGDSDPSVEGRVRGIVRAMINAFGGRQRARKAVTQAVLAQGADSGFLASIAAFISEIGARVGRNPQAVFAALTAEQIFVLSRAVMGAIRSAVLEEQPMLRSRGFEDEMVRLVLAYLDAVT